MAKYERLNGGKIRKRGLKDRMRQKLQTRGNGKRRRISKRRAEVRRKWKRRQYCKEIKLIKMLKEWKY